MYPVSQIPKNVSCDTKSTPGYNRRGVQNVEFDNVLFFLYGELWRYSGVHRAEERQHRKKSTKVSAPFSFSVIRKWPPPKDRQASTHAQRRIGKKPRVHRQRSARCCSQGTHRNGFVYTSFFYQLRVLPPPGHSRFKRSAKAHCYEEYFVFCYRMYKTGADMAAPSL